MVFTSPSFLFLFLPVVLGLYFVSDRVSYRNVLLLVASLLFYAWGEGRFFLVMVSSIGLNYFFGLKISDDSNEKRKRAWLAFAITINLAILLYFKYASFFVENLNGVLASVQLKPLKVPNPHLPAGVSFFTFHALSYLIDVYRGHFRAQRNPVNLGLYIALFPQLIAGPIVRYEYIGPAIDTRSVGMSDFSNGVQRFIVGLGKKMLIANTLGAVADKVFAAPVTDLSSAVAWVGAIAYAFQIYFDFSGYSDMAIGMARMLGFRFPENFNYPYISKSITEFWRRWHISLSSWFRDYLYIPLGGNRVGPFRQYFNLFTVFFLCGLWHGASWNFIVWGLLHGTLLVVEKSFLLRLLGRAPTILARAYTLLMVVLSWVFFRADSLSSASAYIARMFGFHEGPANFVPLPSLIDNEVVVCALAALIGSTPALVGFFRPFQAQDENAPAPAITQWQVYACTFFLALVLLFSMTEVASSTFNAFIYYRF